MAEDYSSKEAQRAAMMRVTAPPLTYERGTRPMPNEPLSPEVRASYDKADKNDRWYWMNQEKADAARYAKYSDAERQDWARQGKQLDRPGSPDLQFNTAVAKLNPPEPPFRDTSWRSPQDALRNLADKTSLPDKQYLPQMGAADRKEQAQAQAKQAADKVAAWEKEWRDTHQYAKYEKEMRDKYGPDWNKPSKAL